MCFAPFTVFTTKEFQRNFVEKIAFGNWTVHIAATSSDVKPYLEAANEVAHSQTKHKF